MVHSIQFTSADPVIQKFDTGPLVFQEAHPDDAYPLYSSLRDVDKAELGIAATDGLSKAERLEEAITVSDVSFSICDTSGTIHGLWGHSFTEPNTGGINGCVWLLSDDWLMKKHGKRMTRIARDYIFPTLDERYGIYGNAMLSRNEVHRDWLKSCGFRERHHFIQSHRKLTLLLRGI